MKAKLLIYALPIFLVSILIYGFSTQDNPSKDEASNVIPTNTLEQYNLSIGSQPLDAGASILYDQSELVSNPGAGFGGADASAITAPGTLFGFGNQISAGNRMADDFTVPPGQNWTIDSIIVFHYQSFNTTTTSTINDVNLQIWNGATPGTGSIVAGDSTTNRLTASEFSNIYRVTATTLTNNARAIMRNQVDMAGTVLGPGTYWIDYTAGGTLASGPWNPPRTIPGQPITGNAFQRLGSTFAWAPALDQQNPQGTPFIIYGSMGCPFPGTPTIEITDLNPNPITCGGVLSIPNHDGHFTVTATGEAREIITLSEIHDLIPADCKSITIDPPLPITQVSPIVVNVTVTRNTNDICVGNIVFKVSDECSPPNESSCRVLFDNPLPVELLSFSSSVTENNVNLTWTTASETNNSGFEIERAATEGEWSKVGEVAGKGTTENPNSYSFTDKVVNSGSYNYRLKQIDYNGNFEYFNLIKEVNIGTPQNYRLLQNYPNPFNPSTTIEYALPRDGFAIITVFDNSGKEVSKLVNEFNTAGYHTVSFDASSLASGIYFYRLEVKGSDNFIQVKKMVLVK